MSTKPNALSHLIPAHVDSYFKDLSAPGHVGQRVSSAVVSMFEATMEQGMQREDVVAWLERAGAVVIDWDANTPDAKEESHTAYFALGFAVAQQPATNKACYFLDAAPEMQAFWVGTPPELIAERLALAFFGLV